MPERTDSMDGRHREPRATAAPCRHVLILILLLFVSACSDSFDPVATTGDEFYALYGVLDTAADTQFVRVSPVRATARPPTPPLDGMVSSVAERAQKQTTWQDSLVQLDDGTTGFLFFTTDEVERGETYALTVRRSDGAETRARLRLPSPRHLEPRDVDETFSGQLRQYVVWQGLDAAPHRATMQYLVQEPGAAAPQWVALPVEDRGRRVPDGWEVEVELSVDRALLLQQALGRSSEDTTVVLRGLGMALAERTEEWRLDDPSSRIENGFGFFGGIVHHEDAWTLPPDVIEDLGFAVPEDGDGAMPPSF